MELTDLEHHPLADKYPVRLPVWWCRTGEAGPHPDVVGVTGKTIVLRFEKTFGRIERFFAKLMKAPRELRRPLLDKNSVLWELCNGQRTFSAGINVFIGLNVMRFVDEKEDIQWNTKPGSIPQGQTLLEQVQFDADLEVREGD